MTARPLEPLSSPFSAFLCSFTYLNQILLRSSCNLRTALWLQPSSDKTVIYPSAILFFSDTDNSAGYCPQHNTNLTRGNFLHAQFLKHRNSGNNEGTQNDHSGGFTLHQNSDTYYALSTVSTCTQSHSLQSLNTSLTCTSVPCHEGIFVNPLNLGSLISTYTVKYAATMHPNDAPHAFDSQPTNSLLFYPV